MKHSSTIKPEWASGPDREADMSDMWIDYVDPQNEDGAVVTGCFEADCSIYETPMEGGFHPGTTFTLRGVSVETTSGFEFFDREWLLKVMGLDAVWMVEECEMEAAS